VKASQSATSKPHYHFEVIDTTYPMNSSSEFEGLAHSA